MIDEYIKNCHSDRTCPRLDGDLGKRLCITDLKSVYMLLLVSSGSTSGDTLPALSQYGVAMNMQFPIGVRYREYKSFLHGNLHPM